MYIAVIALTMFVLPGVAVAIQHMQQPGVDLLGLVGRWFVFWGVGVRLGLAGARQVLQPVFTARQIFHIEDAAVLPLVRELGVCNLAAGVVGLASLAEPSFVLPAAISAAIFYGAAGAAHVAERSRSTNEAIAMASDLFMFGILAVFAAITLVRAI